MRFGQQGARRFYVAQSGEGERLRHILPDATIVILAPVLPQGFARCRASALIPSLNGPEALRFWQDDAKANGSALPRNAPYRQRHDAPGI